MSGGLQEVLYVNRFGNLVRDSSENQTSTISTEGI